MEFISHSGAKAGRPNAHELSFAGGRILFDCGAGRSSPPAYLQKMEEPDVIWISHAHGDHCGALLDLLQRWPRVDVVATKETARLLEFALGGGSSSKQNARVRAVSRKIHHIGWRKFMPIPGIKGARIMALEAGHIPGAAMAVVEFEDGDKRRRVLYTGDFCTHDQRLVAGAGIPSAKDGFGIDAVISEAVLATDKEADLLDYDQCAQGFISDVATADGPVLIGVSSIGESVEVAALLAETGKAVMVDEYLKGVFDVSRERFEGGWEKLVFGDRGRMKGHLAADGVVVAPGDQYRRGTSAAALATPLIEDTSATLMVLNRARKKTGAGRLVAAVRGEKMEWQGRTTTLGAKVIYHRLINHAPRWQLMGFLGGISAPKTYLIHGTTGARWALKRALVADRYGGEVVVVEEGERYGM